jgi:hypothetical protein
VRVTNFSVSGASITLKPVYYKTVSTAGRAELQEDEPETMVTLDAGDTYDLPFPLQKDAGEDSDGWLLKDTKGTTVLQVTFTLSVQSLETFRRKQARAELATKELELREREEKECAMIVNAASDAPVGEAMIAECCVCLDKKLVRQMVTFIPCAHCVCCMDCYLTQVHLDTTSGKRSRCPKCHTFVADVMRVFF